MKFWKVNDAEALAVLVRYADVCGSSVCFVTSINDYFVAYTTGDDVEVTNETNLKPFTQGLADNRTYWAEIVEVDESALNAVGLIAEVDREEN